eukprot:CAMPEP_0114631380 /NCGR_PEP_ID=MMETSP0168-20121206/14382_1 /TAXON_ID=95228 ORGANISM="Vannella sp., Strain DIVA3 517/6/12" /NCGR_SAMPLE_ID=MMETSP0168 /ASSEMBLY_ACC=CAM_ASM_000044 /LENGTH=192 /DNA_ID=CAMNT_0001842943 /DNA_START=23 /DNA_END=601 /DNA_ORIENTATION=+
MAVPRIDTSKMDAVQRTLDSLAESIGHASAMKQEQQDLLDGILKQVEDQVLHAIRLELEVVEKMMEKHREVNQGTDDDEVGTLLASIHKDTSELLEEAAVSEEMGDASDEDVEKSTKREREEGAGDGAKEECSDEEEDDGKLKERMDAVSAKYTRLQRLAQRRMQAKDELLKYELDKREQERPFWKKVLGLR